MVEEVESELLDIRLIMSTMATEVNWVELMYEGITESFARVVSELTMVGRWYSIKGNDRCIKV